MNIHNYIFLLILFLGVDSVYTQSFKKMHFQTIEKVQKQKVEINFVPIFLFYLLVPLGYIFFVKKIAKTKLEFFLYGCLLGLLMYGTFDLTCKAIFVHYPWSYTIIDVAWGTFAVGFASFLGFLLHL